MTSCAHVFSGTKLLHMLLTYFVWTDVTERVLSQEDSIGVDLFDSLRSSNHLNMGTKMLWIWQTIEASVVVCAILL